MGRKTYPQSEGMTQPAPAIPTHLLTECTIQVEFVRQCWDIGINCAPEITIPHGRLDAAIFDHTWTRMLVIVEIKTFQIYRTNKQINRYKMIGLPVFGLWKLDHAAHLAAQIKRDYVDNLKHRGMPYDYILSLPKPFRGLGRRKQTLFASDLDEHVNYLP